MLTNFLKMTRQKMPAGSKRPGKFCLAGAAGMSGASQVGETARPAFKARGSCVLTTS
jgi:hypothetical protein